MGKRKWFELTGVSRADMGQPSQVLGREGERERERERERGRERERERKRERERQTEREREGERKEREKRVTRERAREGQRKRGRANQTTAAGKLRTVQNLDLQRLIPAPIPLRTCGDQGTKCNHILYATCQTSIESIPAVTVDSRTRYYWPIHL